MAGEAKGVLSGIVNLIWNTACKIKELVEKMQRSEDEKLRIIHQIEQTQAWLVRLERYPLDEQMRKMFDDSHQQLLACQLMCEKVFKQCALRQFIKACGNLSFLEYLGIELDRVNARFTTAAVCLGTEQIITLRQELEQMKLELKQDAVYPSAGVYPVREGVRKPPAKVGRPVVNIEGDQMVVSWQDNDSCSPLPIKQKDGQNSLVKYEICLNDLIISQSAEYRSVVLDYLKVVPGKLYTIQVRAVNGSGPGEWSKDTIARFKTAPPSKPAKPEVTIGYAVAEVSVLVPDIELSNGNCITKAVVEYCDGKNSGQWLPIEVPVETTPVQKTIHISDLSPSTTYHFRVIFVNECGQSRPSDSEQMTTDALPIPGVPTKVRKSSYYTSSMLKIRWKPPEENIEFFHSYQVKCKRKKHEYDTKRPFEIIKTKKLSAKFEKLKSDTNYVFFISASNENGGSSQEVRIEAETRWKKATKAALSPLVWLGTTVGTTVVSPVSGAVGGGVLGAVIPDSKAGAVGGAVAGAVGGAVLGTVGAPVVGVATGTAVAHLFVHGSDYSDQSD